LGLSFVSSAVFVFFFNDTATTEIYTRSYEAVVEEWADTAVPADLLVTMGSPLVDREALSFVANVEDLKARLGDGVEIHTARSSVSTIAGVETTTLAVDSADYLAHRRMRVVAGSLPNTALQKNHILINEGFAARTNLVPGSVVAVGANRRLTIDAVVVDYSSDQGWMLIDAADDDDVIKGREGRGRVSALLLHVKDRAAIERVHRALDSEYFVTTQAEARAEILTVARRSLLIARAGEWTLLAVAILSLVCALASSLVERAKELALAHAIGAAQGHVFATAMAEAGVIVLAASLVGVLGAAPLAHVFLAGVGHSATGWNVPLTASPLSIVTSLVLIVMVSGLAVAPFAARVSLQQTRGRNFSS